MDPDEALVQFLLSRPGVAAEVGDRIYPLPLPQGAVLPAITYSDVGAGVSYSFDGPDATGRARYQLDHWARTRSEARRVERTTREALDGFKGTWPGGLRVQGVFRRNGWVVYEPETQLQRAIADYQVVTLGE
jgi:hypothetical protein